MDNYAKEEVSTVEDTVRSVLDDALDNVTRAHQMLDNIERSIHGEAPRLAAESASNQSSAVPQARPGIKMLANRLQGTSRELWQRMQKVHEGL